MISPNEPTTSQSCWRFRMTHGQDVLEAWSETASQASRNAVYRVLFAVQDGSVFRRYQTVDDASDRGFSVQLNGDLVIRVQLDGEAFRIAYIGSTGCPPQ